MNSFPNSKTSTQEIADFYEMRSYCTCAFLTTVYDFLGSDRASMKRKKSKAVK